MKVIPVLLLGLLFAFDAADAHPILALSPKNETSAAATAATAVESHAAANPPESVVEGKNPLECDACMFLANGLNQTIIHNPKVVSFVSADIEQICQIMPSSVQQLCLSAVEQVVPNLLNHLGDFIATEGCSDLGICHT